MLRAPAASVMAPPLYWELQPIIWVPSSDTEPPATSIAPPVTCAVTFVMIESFILVIPYE
eukprot:7379497-Prymnesium_polylepis.1